jgi:AraC-like DNA-binding protein
MILTVPGEEVYYLPENSDHWEFVFLTMVGEDGFRTIKTIENRRGNIIPAKEIPKTMGLFQDFIRELFSKKIDNPFINSSRSYALCMALLEETANKGIPEKLNSFDELLSLLHENIHRDFSVEEMADIMRLSRSHFTRLFTQHTGMSPGRYMEFLRLKTAVSLLQHEGISIKEAAGRVGITDENYFCRVFRKQYGLSPGKIKNKKYWQP